MITIVTTYILKIALFVLLTAIALFIVSKINRSKSKREINAEDLMKSAVRFHGHSCPGLAKGVMAAKYLMDFGNSFSIDEELVSVVENDNCSVDAIQALLGTTFGKGNLVFKDYGKNNFTFYNRNDNKAVKISAKITGSGDKDLPKEERIKIILNSNPADLFNIKEVEFNPPEFAKIHESIICDNCGEMTMSTRIKEKNSRKLCIPCYDKQD